MVETKQIKGEDIIIVKDSVIVERVMDAWNVIINSSTKNYMSVLLYISGRCVRNIQIC